ncbi:aliphatic sulfonate ABC transporter substrate-binding protein [Synechococcus moorigangaii CMS01]|nr:aliphatic sulfonate ABC transporter substrate-binding protein [Synechococcus moorigangaii CMS01]
MCIRDRSNKYDFNNLITRRKSLKFLGGIALGAGLSKTLAACSYDPSTSTEPKPPRTQAAARVVRLGHQKFDPLTLIKARGGLEKRLEAFGTRVEWIEFQSGAPLVEALNVGSIDIGRTGDAPPIFAQAANAPLLYVGSGSPRAQGSGVLVRQDSPLRELAELKGKKLAFHEGSSANFLAVQVIKKAGLSWSDITPVNLSPADARAAFETGSVDAWAIWDPFYAAAEVQINARSLSTSEGLASNRDFFLATQSFVAENGAILWALLEETIEVSKWADSSPGEVVDLLSPITGIEPEVLDRVTRRRNYFFEPMSPDVISE